MTDLFFRFCVQYNIVSNVNKHSVLRLREMKTLNNNMDELLTRKPLQSRTFTY